MKLNLIYNSEIRNNGTPVYFWHAFKQEAVDFVRYLPGSTMRQADFTLWIDDGRDDLTWLPDSGPWAYYATDTHLGWDYRRWKAGKADLVFCAQKPAAKRMRDEGLNAHWVPLACDAMAHPTAEELAERLDIKIPERNLDIAFVGFMQDPAHSNRVAFLDAIFKAHPDFFFAHGIFHEDMARVFHKAKIGINHAVRDDLNMRFFELASMRVPQLCDRRMIGMNDLGFYEGEHFIGYESAEEAIEKIEMYLGDRYHVFKDMAERAHQLVRRKHTYSKRVEAMMAVIETELEKQEVYDLR